MPMDVPDEVTAKKMFDALVGTIGTQRFDLWLGSETKLRFEKKKVIFGVRNHFAVQWVRSNLLREIEQVCVSILGEGCSVDVVVPKKDDRSFVRPCIAEAVKKPETSVAVQTKISVGAGISSGPHFLSGPPALNHATETIPLVRPSIPRPNSPLQSPPSATAFTTGLAPNRPKQEPARRFASLNTFVEGMSNRLACRAADLAVNHPGQINPIYISGPPSIGKTHILEGIWSAVRQRRDRKPPLYMTAEQFISAFLESIQSGTSRDGIQRFRKRFRDISTLLIDDIQLLARAGATQVELLYAIDTLCRQGVQVVLTGDRPLKELKGLRSEILCRLEAGMVCTIEQPEREMALKILQNMVTQRQLPIGTDVCRMVASRLGAHARQLSGALNRLHAVYLGTGKPITLESAEETLADLIRHNRREVRLLDIEKVVCDTFGLSDDALQSKSRAQQISTPRMLAMWLARKYTRSALSEIGRYFGDRSHSSVISAQKKVDAWIDTDHPIHAENADLPISEAIRIIERRLQSG